MALTEAQLRELSSLIDAMQDLPTEDRAHWLAQLPAEQAVFQAPLAQLLHEESQDPSDDAWLTLPKLDAPDQAGSAELSAGAEIGPYRLLRELGVGGMGTVWLAERSDGLLKRPVALKLPHSALPQRQLAERFARERDILAGLTHPHIARLYDAGISAQGQPYLSLEYVEGEPLTSYCTARSLGVVERLDLFGQVLSAVRYAHEHLVVHRDLKPSNILVTAHGKVQLLDFGIAKLLIDGAAKETELTQLGGRSLTVQYASPEQIEGLAISTLSDIYTLGVILYELLTGVLPYRVKRDSRAALEEAILGEEPARPSQSILNAAPAYLPATSTHRLAREIKGDLDTITLKALKKNPQERYASAQAFAADLQRHLAGQPVLAQADSVWYRASKFARRNRLEVSVAVGVVLAFVLDLGLGATAMATFALAVGMVAALWQAREARRQARLAGAAATRAQEEASTARAVQDFLKQIFQANSSNQADPQKARQTTARELLDIGAAKVESALQDVPVAKAQVLQTLGELYHDLGLLDKAVELYSQRLQTLRRSALGSPTELAEAAITLCRVMAQDFTPSVIAQREDLLQEAGRILDQQNDDESELRARWYMQRGYLAMVGNASDACSWAEKAIRVYRGLQPCAAAVEAMADYGIWRINMGQAPETKALLLEALGVASVVGTQANEHLPQVNSVLGNAQLQLEEFADAIASHQQAYRIADQLNGPRHLNTLFAASFLGYTLLRLAQFQEAAQLLGTTLETTLDVRGPDDNVLLPMPLYNHGLARAKLGHWQEGLEKISRAIEILAHRAAPASIPRIETQAELLSKMGRYEQAQALFDETLSHLGSGDTERHWDARVELLLATGQLAVLQKQFPTPEADTAPADAKHHLLWAQIALAGHELLKSQQHATQALEQIQASTQREFRRDQEAQAQQILGKTLLAMEQPQQALIHLEQASEIFQTLLDPQHSPELADAIIAIGQCQLMLNQPDLAQTHLTRAQAIHATHSQLGDQYRRPLANLQTAITEQREVNPSD